jgi:uncharacterized membrane protein (UPF0136 family)
VSATKRQTAIHLFFLALVGGVVGIFCQFQHNRNHDEFALLALDLAFAMSTVLVAQVCLQDFKSKAVPTLPLSPLLSFSFSIKPKN